MGYILQHPNLKTFSVFARLTAGVAEKCGKQEIEPVEE